MSTTQKAKPGSHLTVDGTDLTVFDRAPGACAWATDATGQTVLVKLATPKKPTRIVEGGAQAALDRLAAAERIRARGVRVSRRSAYSSVVHLTNCVCGDADSVPGSAISATAAWDLALDVLYDRVSENMRLAECVAPRHHG